MNKSKMLLTAAKKLMATKLPFEKLLPGLGDDNYSIITHTLSTTHINAIFFSKVPSIFDGLLSLFFSFVVSCGLGVEMFGCV